MTGITAQYSHMGQLELEKLTQCLVESDHQDCFNMRSKNYLMKLQFSENKKTSS